LEFLEGKMEFPEEKMEFPEEKMEFFEGNMEFPEGLSYNAFCYVNASVNASLSGTHFSHFDIILLQI